MPTPKLEFCILLSSPSDLGDEREEASELVRELSSSLAESYPIVLRLLSWENNVAPSFGTEPQNVINAQLGDTWDVYLGMMHARFGTPTASFGSGTEEEFERAFKLWSEKQDTRTLMLYFKKGPVDIDDIDAEQLGKVKSFKSRISSLGGLYKEFTTAENFKDLLRAHLTSVIVDLYKRQRNELEIGTIASKQPMLPENFLEEESSLGILDYVESSMAGMSALTSIIKSIGDDLADSRGLIDSHSQAMQEAARNQDLQGMRRSTTAISKSMLNLAKSLVDRRRDYNSVSRESFDLLSKAISLMKTSPGSIDMLAFTLVVNQAIDMAGAFVVMMRSVERTMNTLPNLAKEFNIARMQLKREFRNLAIDVDSSIALLRNLLDIAQN